MLPDMCDQTGVLVLPGVSQEALPDNRVCDIPAREPMLSPAEQTLNSSIGTDCFKLPDLGPRYRPIRKLGQGGMGAVYLSEDNETGARVAVKVLPLESIPDQQAVQRFQKETRLLAEVRHPNVANLLEAGRHGNTYYLVMELVEGIDLGTVLQRKGSLPERLALQIIADIAAALSVAHERGIVHRDLKPGNIMLSAVREGDESPADAVFAALEAGQPPTVKLTDFGLARQIDQAASMDLTKTGMFLGTPYYISPEQCTDKGVITAAADVYSLGATLFELLTGRPPFNSNDPIKLISMHCFEQPPNARKINPEVSDGVAELVTRTLQKLPAARFADGGHLLVELNRLLRGEAVCDAVHPSVPVPTGKVFEAIWEWDLDGSPSELWPWVSNTERVNAAVGLPPVEYVTRRDEYGEKHRFGSFRLGWTRLVWEEHPFEWVEGRRLSVLRQFENGPFEWFVSVVEVTPRPEGGSRLSHKVRIAARGWLGRLIAHIEVNIKGRKPLDKIYRRINEVVTGRIKQSPATDPFLTTPKTPTSLQKKITTIREKLARQSIAPDVLDGLLEFLAQSPAQELARIRPRALARRLRINADQLTSACLAGCHSGLLELHWDILCPTCRVAAEVKDTLNSIDDHAHCEACEHNFEVDFSSSVELIFRVHPEFRQADLKTYCIGGPEHAPHVVAQTQLEPGEVLELDLALDAGSYILRGAQLPYTIRIIAESATGTSRMMVDLNPKRKSNRPVRVHTGRQLLTLKNDYLHPMLVRLERIVTRNDAMTATEAMRLPAFQQMFPAEAITRDRLSNLSTCTLVGIRIANLLDLFVSIGDGGTGSCIRRVFDSCRSTIESHGGNLVKESDDRLLAVFPQALAALHSVLELQDLLDISRSVEAPQVRFALHRGMAMATSINGRLDYFGRSVSLTNRLLDNASSLFVLSQELAQDEECRQFLADSKRIVRQVSQQGELSIFDVGRMNLEMTAPSTSSVPLKPCDSTAVMCSLSQNAVVRVSR